MVIITTLERLRNVLIAQPINLVADVTVAWMWIEKDRLELSSMPRSLRWIFSSIGVLSGERYWVSGLDDFPGQNRRHSNLSELNTIFTSLAHLYILARSLWSVWESVVELIHLHTLVSSTYDVVLVSADTSRAISAMCRRNKIGPRTVPWGTPLRTGESPDTRPSTATACCLCLASRNAASHQPTLPSTFPSLSLCRRTPVSTLSKAFKKSR